MNTSALDQLVNAVLYEGYILYPYRASSVKNQRERFTFGRVYPQAFSEAQAGAESSLMQTECLVEVSSRQPRVSGCVRFLQPLRREVGIIEPPVLGWDATAKPPFHLVQNLEVDGAVYQTWLEAVERGVPIPEISLGEGERQIQQFEFAATQELLPILNREQHAVGALLRRTEAIRGVVEILASSQAPGAFRVTVRISNLSALPGTELENQDAILARTFASAHTILRAQGAAFVSLMDPPEAFKQAAAACKNIGTWPVLVGREEIAERDTLLSSPIILYDYPQIAPESQGDLFDNLEIDEILSLRILTMTEDEKREMRNVDALGRRMLERTEALEPASLLNLHGALRGGRSLDEQIFGGTTRLEEIQFQGACLKPGCRVRIRPKARADIMDLALAGRTAVVEAVEQDAEGRVHLALVVDDDPGRELGFARQPGHRFFFALEEIEPLEVNS